MLVKRRSKNTLYSKNYGKPVKFLAWINKDFETPGQEIILPSKCMKSWSCVMGFLTIFLRPNFGAVRKLYHLDTKTPIHCLQDIKTGEKYVAVGSDKFKFSKNGQRYLTKEEKLLNSQRKKSSLSADQMKHIQICLTDFLGYTKKKQRTVIYFMVSGRSCQIPLKAVLIQRDLLDENMLLHYLSYRLDVEEGIQYICDVDGKIMPNLSALKHGELYIAVPYKSSFIKLDYHSLFNELMATKQANNNLSDNTKKVKRNREKKSEISNFPNKDKQVLPSSSSKTDSKFISSKKVTRHCKSTAQPDKILTDILEKEDNVPSIEIEQDSLNSLSQSSQEDSLNYLIKEDNIASKKIEQEETSNSLSQQDPSNCSHQSRKEDSSNSLVKEGKMPSKKNEEEETSNSSSQSSQQDPSNSLTQSRKEDSSNSLVKEDNMTSKEIEQEETSNFSSQSSQQDPSNSSRQEDSLNFLVKEDNVTSKENDKEEDTLNSPSQSTQEDSLNFLVKKEIDQEDPSSQSSQQDPSISSSQSRQENSSNQSSQEDSSNSLKNLEAEFIEEVDSISKSVGCIKDILNDVMDDPSNLAEHRISFIGITDIPEIKEQSPVREEENKMGKISSFPAFPGLFLEITTNMNVSYVHGKDKQPEAQWTTFAKIAKEKEFKSRCMNPDCLQVKQKVENENSLEESAISYGTFRDNKIEVMKGFGPTTSTQRKSILKATSSPDFEQLVETKPRFLGIIDSNTQLGPRKRSDCTNRKSILKSSPRPSDVEQPVNFEPAVLPGNRFLSTRDSISPICSKQISDYIKDTLLKNDNEKNDSDAEKGTCDQKKDQQRHMKNKSSNKTQLENIYENNLNENEISINAKQSDDSLILDKNEFKEGSLNESLEFDNSSTTSDPSDEKIITSRGVQKDWRKDEEIVDKSIQAFRESEDEPN